MIRSTRSRFRVAMLLVLAWCVSLGSGVASRVSYADGEAAVSEREVQKVVKAHGLELVTADPRFPVSIPHGIITGAAASREDVATYRTLLPELLSHYTPALWKKAGVRRLVLCTDLAFNAQQRFAIPDFSNDTLYLLIGWKEESRGLSAKEYKAYLRRVFHHDLFHMIDYADDRALYSDPAWLRLNPPEFTYGTGGKNMLGDAGAGVLSRALPGFLNRYATSGVEEDKAETYTYLIMRSATLLERMRAEPVLAAKVAYTVRLMEAFEPGMLAKLSPELLKAAWTFGFRHVRLTDAEGDGAETGEGVRLLTLAAARSTAAKHGRPLLLYVARREASGDAASEVTRDVGECRACRELESGVLQSKAARLAAIDYHLVRLDVEDERAREAMRALGVKRLPSLVLFDAKGAKREVLRGKVTAKRLAKELTAVAK